MLSHFRPQVYHLPYGHRPRDAEVSVTRAIAPLPGPVQGLAALLSLVLFTAPGISQQPDTWPATASPATVRLEVKDGQSHFLLGDRIELELVFTNPGSDAYTLNTTEYGDLSEKVNITPSDGWLQWRGPSGHDYSMVTKLESKEIRIPVVLNDGFVFREPGHYEVSVTTGRLQQGKPLASDNHYLQLTTNAVGLDLSERSAAEEAALVRTLTNEIDSLPVTHDPRADPRADAAARLASLPGDAAVRAKVRLLLDDSDWAQALHYIISGGLAASRNLTLQLSLLQAAWNDPQRTPDSELESAISTTRHFLYSKTTLPGWQMMVMPPSGKPDAATQQAIDEHNADLTRLIQSLPARSGDNRRDTTYFLMENHNLTSAQLALVKPIALEEFTHMEPMAQSMLIETRWDALQDPSLAPALKAMIDSNQQWSDAATAVQRLIQIDEPDSRSYVVKMVCSPKRGLLLDKLAGVKQDRLPEVDACLSALLRHGERNPHDFDWEQAAQRAARFATPEILPAIKEGWKDPTQYASMLPVLLRDAPAEAMALLAKQPKLDLYPTNTVFTALAGRFPPEMLTWLRPQLKDGPLESVGTVAYELSEFGEPADRQLIEERLATLRRQWSGHESELLGDGTTQSPALAAKSAEQNLVAALLGAKQWKLTDEEKTRLTDACMSDWCRRYAPRKAQAGKL